MTLIPMGLIPALYADRFGESRLAIEHPGERVSWGDLERRANRRARALQAAGVQRDDLVTVALPNGGDFYEMTFAIWKLGATPHVVPWRLPLRELSGILETAKPRIMVASDQSLIKEFSAVDISAPIGDWDDKALPAQVSSHWKAMSSGGSTGRPKIIVDHMRSEIDPDVARLLIPSEGVVLNPGPLYHNAPFTVTHRALFRGCTVIGMSRFDAEETLRLIDRHKVQWLNMVPTMMSRIWRLPPDTREAYDVSSLTHVWHMAAPMPRWLKEAWIEWLGPDKIWELYGGTEAQGTTVISGSEWLTHRGSVGKPIRCTMRAQDDQGNVLDPGEVGELFIRPDEPSVQTYHYIGAEARRSADGFESIGDYGWIDEDGYVYLCDRRTDLIVRGGANIYPAEIESALSEHPAIDTAVVIGLPDEDLGQRVHAIIRPQASWSDPISVEDLRSFLLERLASYKLPTTFEVTSEELRDDAGKVRRFEFRQQRTAGTERAPALT